MTRQLERLCWLLLLALPCSLGCSGEPSDAAEGVSAGAIEAVARTAVRVRVATVEACVLGGDDDVSAIVSPFREASVAAEAASRVVERHVEPGQQVKAGDPLIALDASRLTLAVDEARASLRAREVDLAEARHELARSEELARSNATSHSERDRLRFGVDRAKSALALARAGLGSAQRALEDATIAAPFDGTVDSVYVDVGDFTSPGTPIATVVDLARVRVRAGVTAAQAEGLAEGSEAVVLAASFGGEPRRSAIQSIGRMADGASGTYPVEIWLDNQDGKLRGGMVADLRLSVGDTAPSLVIPAAALSRRQDGLGVFVLDRRGDTLRAVVHRVRVGRRRSDVVEVLGGVEAGDRVIVDGHFALADGESVQIDVSDASTGAEG